MRVFVSRSGDFEQPVVIPLGKEGVLPSLIDLFHFGNHLPEGHLFFFDPKSIQPGIPLHHRRCDPLNVFLDALTIHEDFTNVLVKFFHRNIHHKMNCNPSRDKITNKYGETYEIGLLQRQRHPGNPWEGVPRRVRLL